MSNAAQSGAAVALSPAGGAASDGAAVALPAGGAQVATLSPSEVQVAQVALRRYKREGHDCDPLDRDHQMAYTLCRQVSAAPRAREVMAAIASQTLQHQRSLSVGMSHWVVPKSNFGGSAPEWLAKSIHSREHLLANFGLGQEQLQVPDAAWIVDGGVRRNKLGLNVGTVNFDQSMAQRMTTSRSQQGALADAPGGGAPSSAARGSGAPRGSDEAEGGGSGVAEGGGAPSGVALGGGAPPETQAAKRQRVMRRVESDEGEDPELDNLTSFVDKVDAAAEAGLWYSAESTSMKTVHFWCVQLLDTLPLQEGTAERQSAEQQKLALLKAKFPRHLQRLVVGSPCFRALGKLAEIFDQLEAAGCPAAPLKSAFRALSEFDLTSRSAVDFKASGAPFKKRLELLSSPLMKDFQVNRVEVLLAAGCLAPTAERREEVLTTLRLVVREVEPEAAILVDAKMADAMFSRQVPLVERVKYALADPAHRAARLRLAVTWGECGGQALASGGALTGGRAPEVQSTVPWRAVRYIAELGEPPASMAFDELLQGASLIAEAGLLQRKALGNPLAFAAAEFCVALQQLGERCADCKTQLCALRQSAVACRLKATRWQCADDGCGAPSCHAREVLPKVEKLLAGASSGKPEWLKRLRQQVEEQNKEREAAAAKALALAAEARSLENALQQTDAQLAAATEAEAAALCAAERGAAVRTRAAERPSAARQSAPRRCAQGDVVRLTGTGKNKALDGCTATVQKATAGTCSVKVLDGNCAGEVRRIGAKFLEVIKDAGGGGAPGSGGASGGSGASKGGSAPMTAEEEKAWCAAKFGPSSDEGDEVDEDEDEEGSSEAEAAPRTPIKKEQRQCAE